MKRYSLPAFLALGAVTVLAVSFAAAQGKRVAVPRVYGEEVLHAYKQLHRAEFRVSIDSEFAFSTDRQGHVIFPETVVRTIPAPGRLVKEGSIVRVFVRCECRPGHTPEPSAKPVYNVPDFTKALVSKVYRWVRSKVLVFIAHLGPIKAADALTLFKNYRVDKQSPAAGSQLRYSNRSGAWTPLRVWAHQTG